MEDTSRSRRAVLAGIASAGALPIVAAMPTVAPARPPDHSVDPIFAAVEEFRLADDAVIAACDVVPEDEDLIEIAWCRRDAAHDHVLCTRPTTPAGLVALTTWARERMDWLRNHGTSFEPDKLYAISAAIDDAARGMSGLKAWSPPAADKELIDLGAKLEPLTDQYYIARKAWQAAALKDRRKADDKMYAISERMRPLERAIEAAPVTSIEGLRAKALVAFREYAPLTVSSTRFSFGDDYAAQNLFAAVAEVCGLMDKVEATGYYFTDYSPDADGDTTAEA
jgi:hypothetical protein